MSRLGQIKQAFKSVRIEIKAFLRRQQWKEALIFFCFILLAFGFWLLQSLQQEYEIDIKIPVKYKNVHRIYLSRKHRPKPLRSK